MDRFEQSNMHRTLDFCPDQPGRNQMYTKLRSYIFGFLLSDLYTVQCQKANVKHAVQFYVEDATLMDYPDQFYDMGSIFLKK